VRVRVSGGAVGVEQGCVSAPAVDVGGGEGFVLAPETSYCYMASFQNGSLTQRLERSVPLDKENATEKHHPFDLSALAPFDSITVNPRKATQTRNPKIFRGACHFSPDQI